MRLTDARTDVQLSRDYTVRSITCSRAVKITADSMPRTWYRAAHSHAHSSHVVIFHLSKQVTILLPRFVLWAHRVRAWTSPTPALRDSSLSL